MTAMTAQPATGQHSPDLALPCTQWTGAIDSYGYGRLQRDGRWQLAHRLAFEEQVGPIPDGLTIDHLCAKRDCVNVRHMEPVTNAENVLRGVGPTAVNARKSHCIAGHLLSGDNLRLAADGRRECKECSRRRWRTYRGRKIAEGTWTRT